MALVLEADHFRNGSFLMVRGRVGAVNFLFINASNQLGQFQSGVVAALLGTVASAVLGGVATVGNALLWMKLFPILRDVEKLE